MAGSLRAQHRPRLHWGDRLPRVPNPDALAVVQVAVSLTRSHSHALVLDVLDLVMCGREQQALEFSDSAAPNDSLGAPGAPFGQLLAAAFDEVMTRTEWKAFTGATADATLRDGCLEIWRVCHAEVRGSVWRDDPGATVAAAVGITTSSWPALALRPRTVGGPSGFRISAVERRG